MARPLCIVCGKPIAKLFVTTWVRTAEQGRASARAGWRMKGDR